MTQTETSKMTSNFHFLETYSFYSQNGPFLETISSQNNYFLTFWTSRKGVVGR